MELAEGLIDVKSEIKEENSADEDLKEEYSCPSVPNANSRKLRSQRKKEAIEKALKQEKLSEKEHKRRLQDVFR